MIYNDNNSTSKVFYSGFTITKVYACDGELIWAASPYAFKAMYTLNNGTTGQVSCNSDSVLRASDYGSYEIYHNIKDLVVGECVDAIESSSLSTIYESLRTVDMSHSNITSLGAHTFEGCTYLRDVTFGSGTTSIGTSAFNGCTSLSAITIPSTITNIGLNAFYQSGLKEVTMYSGITYSYYVYGQCPLTAVTIEEGVTEIPQGTFSTCADLTEITVPSSVQYIGEHAFVNLFGLDHMTINATTPPNLGNEAIGTSNSTFPIYVPCSAMSAYTAHSDWQPYIDRLRPIENQCESIIYRWQPSGTTCVGVDKYNNNIKQISYNSGATWSNVSPSEYSASTLIERNSTDCGYIEPQYRTISTAVTCSGVDKYKVDEHQESLDGGVTWTTTSTTIGDLIQANSYDCGYRTRTTSGTPYCVDVDKYQDVYSEYSTDSGTTWITASTTPTLIEHNSEDCGYVPPIEPQYRTLTTATTCVGYDKHVLEEHQESLDGGVTWTTTATTTGSLIEADSEDCGYVPPTPTNFKISANYIGGTNAVADCNTSTTLTFSEIKNLGEGYTAMTSAAVGNCTTTVDSYAFNGDDFRRCKNLSSITFSDSVTSIGRRAFTGNGLREVSCGSGLTSIGDCAFAGNYNLSALTIPNVTTIEEGAFQNCSGLTSLVLPDTLTTIGSNCFYNCKSLTNVHLSNNLTTIGEQSFYGNTSLTSINIPNSVATIGMGAFAGCHAMTAVTIGSGITSIGDSAFNACSGLTSITINATVPPTIGVFTFDKTNNCPLFVPCQSLSAYQTAWSNYASRLQCIPTPLGGNVITYTSKYKLAEVETPSVATSGLALHAFSGTSGQQLTIISHTHDYDTSAGTITFDGDVVKFGAYAFNRCSGMTEINLPITLTEMVNSGLRECRALTGVTIPNSVTLLGASNFNNCTSLTAVTIPSSVTTIERQCFQGCSNLVNLTVEATTPPTLGTSVFQAVPLANIYVPSEAVETYKAAKYWKNYASIIQAIP